MTSTVLDRSDVEHGFLIKMFKQICAVGSSNAPTPSAELLTDFFKIVGCVSDIFTLVFQLSALLPSSKVGDQPRTAPSPLVYRDSASHWMTMQGDFLFLILELLCPGSGMDVAILQKGIGVIIGGSRT